MPPTLATPPVAMDTSVALVAPISGFSDIPQTGLCLPAWIFPARRPALPFAVTRAGQHPGSIYGVFTFADAFGITTHVQPILRPGRSKKRLLSALADYLGAPPKDADGPQLNAARALQEALAR